MTKMDVNLSQTTSASFVIVELQRLRSMTDEQVRELGESQMIVVTHGTDESIKELSDHMLKEASLTTEDLTDAVDPDGMTMHEAYDRLNMIRNLFVDNVVAHPSILANPKWFAAAIALGNALEAFFEDIERTHFYNEEQE